MRGIKREAIRDEDSDGQAEARIEALFFRATRRAGEASSPTYEGAPAALDITAQLVNLLRGTDVSASRLFHGSLPL